jgi:HTH-type transcriptional regulator/antitoxin HigA
MEIKPISTEIDYKLALERIEILWGAKKGSSEGDELDLLATLVEAWEMKNYPVLPPDPVDAIKFRMSQMNLTSGDIGKIIGSRSRVSEILKRKRKITLKMAKALHEKLMIPAETFLT